MKQFADRSIVFFIYIIFLFECRCYIRKFEVIGEHSFDKAVVNKNC